MPKLNSSNENTCVCEGTFYNYSGHSIKKCNISKDFPVWTMWTGNNFWSKSIPETNPVHKTTKSSGVVE